LLRGKVSLDELRAVTQEIGFGTVPVGIKMETGFTSEK
jgi:hypothetical protein